MARKKTGVRYLNVNYNVNENKRTVACVLTSGICLDNVPYIGMLIHCPEWNNVMKNARIESWINDETGKSNLYVVHEVVEFADCNPDDKFDASLGKKIALTRAQKESFKIASEFYAFAESCILNAAERMNALGENCDSSYKNCKNHVIELIDSAQKA